MLNSACSPPSIPQVSVLNAQTAIDVGDFFLVSCTIGSFKENGIIAEQVTKLFCRDDGKLSTNFNGPALPNPECIAGKINFCTIV